MLFRLFNIHPYYYTNIYSAYNTIKKIEHLYTMNTNTLFISIYDNIHSKIYVNTCFNIFSTLYYLISFEEKKLCYLINLFSNYLKLHFNTKCQILNFLCYQ